MNFIGRFLVLGIKMIHGIYKNVMHEVHLVCES